MDAGHAVEAELVGEACEMSAPEHSILDPFSVALTSDRVCRFTVEHRGAVVVEIGLAIDRTLSQIVISLDDWHRFAEVQLLPTVGSTARSVADAPAVLKDHGPKSLEEQSLVLALVSFELFRSQCLDNFEL